MNREEFYLEISKLGIELTDNQKLQLEQFANLLIEYNKKINITSITDIRDIYLKHFYDSLTIVKSYNITNETILDIGSGGGFPGIVLKIVFPNTKITLLDSNHKKTDFQKYIIKELGLNDIYSVNERAENFFKKGNKYDIVVARAVAPLKVLIELSIPFVKIDGYFIAMRGNNSELNDSQKAIEILGGKILKITEFNLFEIYGERTLILIKKERNTPNIYPREYNKILKKPIE